MLSDNKPKKNKKLSKMPTKIQYIDEPTPLLINGEKIISKISTIKIILQQAPYASFDAENSLSSPEPVVEKLIKPVFVERVDRVHFKNYDSIGILGSVKNLRHDILDTVKANQKFGSTKTLDAKDYFARNRHCPIASLSRNTTYDGFPIFAVNNLLFFIFWMIYDFKKKSNNDKFNVPVLIQTYFFFSL